MGWIGGAIAAAGSIIGGSMSSDAQSSAASNAAQTSAAASNYAANLQKQAYDQTRADQAPWRTTGASAVTQLAGRMGIDTPVSYAQPETRAQILARMTPQYTTSGSVQNPTTQSVQNPTTQSVQNPVGVGWLGNINGDASSWMGISNSDPASFGGNSGSNQSSTTDWNALNSAVDAEYAKQQTAAGQMQPRDANFGSFTTPFSQTNWQADPGYAFRLKQGSDTLQAGAAARGGLLGGNALKALMDYGQQAGSQEYGAAYNRYNNDQSTEFNRLANVAGIGQTANTALQSAGNTYSTNAGNLAVNSANNTGNAGMAAANATASSYKGIGNALGNVNWGGVGNALSNAYNNATAPAGMSYGNGGYTYNDPTSVGPSQANQFASY